MELLKYKSKEVQESVREYSKFERMRQTWGEPNPNENGSNKIYYKIKNNGCVMESDIEEIVKDAKNKGVFGTKEFNEYFDYLNQIKGNKSSENNSIDDYKKQLGIFEKYSNEFLNGFKIYKDTLGFVLKNNWVVTKKEQEWICGMIANIQLKLNNISGSLGQLKKVLSKNNLESEKGQTYYLNLAEEIQNFMYGKNNFYQKGAQKVFNKYKKVYDLILKCNKNKFNGCLDSLSYDNKFNEVISILVILEGVSIDAYGENNKYLKKISELIAN